MTADYPPECWSGIATAVAHQAEALAALGTEVHVLTTARGAKGDGANLQVHWLNKHAFPLEVKAADVVHVHSLSLAALGIELARRYSLPLLVTAHTLPHRELPGDSEGAHWWRVQQGLFAAARHVYFPSHGLRAQALTDAPQLAARSSVLANGLPATQWATEGGPRDAVVFAGRFARSKGIDVAAAVARELLGHGEITRAVFAGGHGDRESDTLLAQFAARSPNQWERPGWLSSHELQAVFARAALVLMPSRFEPFGMVALEAMQMGAVVAGAAVGGLSGILAPPSGGIAVDGHNVQRWVAICRNLLDDPDRLGQLRRAGPECVARRYCSRDLAQCLLHSVAIHC